MKILVDLMGIIIKQYKLVNPNNNNEIMSLNYLSQFPLMKLV